MGSDLPSSSPRPPFGVPALAGQTFGWNQTAIPTHAIDAAEAPPAEAGTPCPNSASPRPFPTRKDAFSQSIP